MHARHVAEIGTCAPPEDTLFMVMLLALALFGEGGVAESPAPAAPKRARRSRRAPDR